MKTFLKVLGFLWLLPATVLVWLFYVLPLWVIGEIKYEGKADTFIWIFQNPIGKSYYDKLWAKWAGWSGPCVYIYKPYLQKDYPWISQEDLDKYTETTRVHEVRHCVQQFVFGVFHYPLYALESARIWFLNLFRPYEKKKHIYLFNRFEIDARKAAGQTVNVPRENWPDGPNDYNPWL